LDAQPELITREWNVTKVNNLLLPLMEQKVRSRSKLLQVWQTDPKFLLSSVQDWIDESHRRELAATWPPKDVPAERYIPARSSTSSNNNNTTTTNTASASSAKPRTTKLKAKFIAQPESDSESSECSDLEYLYE
jgi:hypothetical protein